MKKARRTIADALSSKDVVLEVLDARMPASSSNPVLKELRRGKPCIKILSKSDLADPRVTQAWITHFETQTTDPGVVAVALSRDNPAEVRTRIAKLCHQLAPDRSSPSKRVRALVVGIPNVGKSTLLNVLMERKVARVGDEPAVTKSEQLVTLKSGMTISDNAGILWPRIGERTALRLALGGAMPDSVLDYETVARFGAEFLLARYPALLCARFKLESAPATPEALLDLIGRKHGCLRSGGVVDSHKAADVLLHQFRAGTLGRISLEAPGDVDETPPESPLDEHALDESEDDA
jgi:ribosome biogenesis GTPase A